MNPWEYKLIGPGDLGDAGSLEAKLNELGADGWELVAYVGYQQLDSMVLKRPKGPEIDEESEPEIF